ncbi:hypothetical protein [Serratia plymuthica]|uniref:hypothetical protein n=1 Tax=Serratia plymuthica TaxID=82996 RepID=UPI0007E9C0A3|nr:hypothetical protein [Serratia plymuthica]ANJ99072.1 hypothetical protein ADP73_14390 [Serratia plymuthica]
MTKTLTTGELRQIVDSHEKGYGMSVPINYGYLAARELLANREAQPVALVDRRSAARGSICWQGGGKDLPHGTELFTAPPAPSDAQPVAWLAIYHGEVYDEAISITRSVVEAQADRFGWESALTEIIPLYRHAPPAPAVNPEFTGAPAVPDEQTVIEKFKQWWSSKERGFTIINADLQKELQWEAWQDCCAAMLAQPVSQGYRLVPIEPTDEQLRAMLAVIWPATYREHLRHPDNGPVSIARAEEEIKQAKEQYAAALAAAPEGGNG